MGKKKICFIAQFPPPMHGLAKAVETLYNSELAQEFDFEKIDITDNRKIMQTLTMIRKSKADLFYFTIAQSVGGNLRDLMIFYAIGNRPCLVHLHGGYYRTLVDGLSGWHRKANYNAIGKLSGVIVLGPSLKWIFKGMLPEDKIFTVPNCVDDEYLMSDEEFDEKMVSLPDRKIKHVLYLSNFIRSKGYREVLEMARVEKKRGGEKRYHFDFAGKFFGKNEEVFFRKYIEHYGLEEYVTYHGIVDGEKKMNLLRSCDIFCLLTSYPKEGQPISILEAMGNGMIIITTNHAGIPDLVVDGINGIVASRNCINPTSIYKSLEKLPFEEIEKKNRFDVMKQFRERTYIENMKKTFEKAMNK